MCHGIGGRDWSRDSDDASDESTDKPSFLNDEDTEDVEILTDGGDEE
jgi:hypothetical protein